ncbi:hypothetical protein JHL21_01440 [Devosia sp. WQ 349]|nr:hypothetical protein [Devosia sp. WQ 349K1]
MRLPATLVWGDGLLRAAGTIIEQSSGGARVRLDEETKVAADCYLLFSHRLEPCRVIWQAQGSIGLSFVLPE